ncbi:MAG: hypothetical protein HY927_15480 [Elusimicrobia bacterium]|nr:hypothetical protein [Elusimicrobiota bacterium]
MEDENESLPILEPGSDERRKASALGKRRAAAAATAVFVAGLSCAVLLRGMRRMAPPRPASAPKAAAALAAPPSGAAGATGARIPSESRVSQAPTGKTSADRSDLEPLVPYGPAAAEPAETAPSGDDGAASAGPARRDEPRSAPAARTAGNPAGRPAAVFRPLSNFVALSPRKRVAGVAQQVGVGFEDTMEGSDNDFDDAVVCLSGLFKVQGAHVTSYTEQDVVATVSASSACRHKVRIAAWNPDKTREKEVVVDSQDAAPVRLHMRMNSRLEVAMTPYEGAGCRVGEERGMRDPRACRVTAGPCGSPR